MSGIVKYTSISLWLPSYFMLQLIQKLSRPERSGRDIPTIWDKQEIQQSLKSVVAVSDALAVLKEQLYPFSYHM